MTPESIARVRETWALVAPIADTAADLFYQRLFALDPRLRLMFGSTDWAAQRRKLVHALNLAVASLDRVQEIAPRLEALGSRHAASYGVQDCHYDTVGEALIATLKQGLGEAWTAEAAAAWKEAYDIVSGAMRRAPGRVISGGAAA
ncbi:MAG TPA: globin domain-containing protein [Hyphomicrobiaceae bacterium]|jgi:hemoglobin-like flavoprotein|nr:globin domain-containing protein [Hyphomicrobiaceae bacterium]